MLHSTGPFPQLKEVATQHTGQKRKSGAKDFFQYFTRSPLYLRACARIREEKEVPYEINEIMKEHIYTRVLKGLPPNFFQWHGLKPMKKVSGGLVARHMTPTRPRDPGPGEIAALTRLAHRPDRPIEEEVVMDLSTHIATAPVPATGGPNRCILALDLGTTTGWALRAPDALITSGTVSFRPGRFDGGGMRYLRFTNWLTEIDRLSGPVGAIWFEEVRRHAGTDAAHVYGGLMATLTTWAELRGVAYAGVPVGTIKRHATGKGNADKVAMIAAVRSRGFSPVDDNEADAIALLLWAIETNGGLQ